MALLSAGCSITEPKGHTQEGHHMDMDDVNALVDQATPVELTHPLCLKQSLVAKYEKLDRQRADAASRGNASSLAGDGSEAAAIVAQMELLREEMQAATVMVTLRAMPRKKFRKLCDLHPPRRDDDGKIHDDDSLGVNTVTLWDPLIRACLVDPEFDAVRLTRILDDILSDRQYEELANRAWAVNRHMVDVPFSLAAFMTRPSSTDE